MNFWQMLVWTFAQKKFVFFPNFSSKTNKSGRDNANNNNIRVREPALSDFAFPDRNHNIVDGRFFLVMPQQMDWRQS